MSLDSVAKTSLLTAAMRAVETARSDSEGRLFNDPFARQLAGEEGFTILKNAIAASGDQPVIAIRTKFVDDRMMAAVASGISQIVSLASGMDSRSYRLHFPAGTKYFELDRQEVLDYKSEKLSGAQPTCDRYEIGVDLRDPWEAKLRSKGMDPAKPTLWLVEGLLMYLQEDQVRSLLSRISSLSTKQSMIICDILGRSLLESPFMTKQLEFLASIGAPWKFGTDEPETFLKEFGWEATIVTSAGEVAPHRWPFPVAPRHVPGVPRGYFVEAHKL